jgi:hypothetical protein
VQPAVSYIDASLSIQSPLDYDGPFVQEATSHQTLNRYEADILMIGEIMTSSIINDRQYFSPIIFAYHFRLSFLPIID